jgi:hypothetical protein
MNMTVFWDVAPCNLVGFVRHFGGAYFIALMMEAVSTFETSVSLYQTTGATSSEDGHLQHSDCFFPPLYSYPNFVWSIYYLRS